MRASLRLIGVALLATFLVPSAAGAGAAPQSSFVFELVMDGRVGRQVAFAKWLHEGTFTASPPFCSTGTGVDLSATATRPTVSERVFTCTNGSDGVTARVVNHEVEYTPDVEGTWQIVDGSGAFARLRGKGR